MCSYCMKRKTRINSVFPLIAHVIFMILMIKAISCTSYTLILEWDPRCHPNQETTYMKNGMNS